MKYRIVKILDGYYIQRKRNIFRKWEYFYTEEIDKIKTHKWSLSLDKVYGYYSILTACSFKTADDAELFFRDKLIPKVIKYL